MEAELTVAVSESDVPGDTTADVNAAPEVVVRAVTYVGSGGTYTKAESPANVATLVNVNVKEELAPTGSLGRFQLQKSRQGTRSGGKREV
jgi:hypothetical protein